MHICWDPKGVADILANAIGLERSFRTIDWRPIMLCCGQVARCDVRLLLSHTPSPIWMLCVTSVLAGFAYIVQGCAHLIVS